MAWQRTEDLPAASAPPPSAVDCGPALPPTFATRMIGDAETVRFFTPLVGALMHNQVSSLEKSVPGIQAALAKPDNTFKPSDGSGTLLYYALACKHWEAAAISPVRVSA